MILERDTRATIEVHTKAIAELLNVEAARSLERLRKAEQEALERIGNIAPVELDYDAAAAYVGLSRRTFERPRCGSNQTNKDRNARSQKSRS